MTRVRNFVRLIWSITVLGCRADELTVKRTFWASVAAKEAEFATANGRSLVKWGQDRPQG
jgi:hypothetical protein